MNVRTVSDSKVLHTDEPAVIGSWISNTMIRTVNVLTSGGKSVVEHKTLPMLKWIGSTAVKHRVALELAAAHGTYSSLISIAACGI